jgi:hypothetical protein
LRNCCLSCKKAFGPFRAGIVPERPGVQTIGLSGSFDDPVYRDLTVCLPPAYPSLLSSEGEAVMVQGQPLLSGGEAIRALAKGGK